MNDQKNKVGSSFQFPLRLLLFLFTISTSLQLCNSSSALPPESSASSSASGEWNNGRGLWSEQSAAVMAQYVDAQSSNLSRSASDLGSFSGLAERVVFKSSKRTATDLVQGGVTSWNLSRSASSSSVAASTATAASWRPPEGPGKPPKKSASDLIRESYGSLGARKARLESFEFSSSFLDAMLEAKDPPLTQGRRSSRSESVSGSVKDGEREMTRSSSASAASADVGRRSEAERDGDIPLPQSAALYYTGNSGTTENADVCASVKELNSYLQERKNDLKAGVPGQFLGAVIGQEVADISSVASTIVYAFYLHETSKSREMCTLPIINMKRGELNMHPELKWLLQSCHVDLSSLVFADEIDLSYYDLFGCLKLVLLNGQKIHTKQEVNTNNSWVETVTLGEDGSSCTVIAENFAMTSPEILAGRGFCRLLLAGILMDTGNLTNPKCTSKDKYMTTLLIKGAGRFGCNGLHQILKYKMSDITDLKVKQILRKDFKKWTRVAGKPDGGGSRLSVSHIGMSSIGISVAELLSHESSAEEEIILFQQSEKLRLLIIVSGYYDDQKNFKREILVSADTPEHMRNFLNFFNSNDSQLPLKVLNQPGLREELRAFEINNMITSRKTIERLLEEFGGTNSKRG